MGCAADAGRERAAREDEARRRELAPERRAAVPAPRRVGVDDAAHGPGREGVREGRQEEGRAAAGQRRALGPEVGPQVLGHLGRNRGSDKARLS